MDVYVHIMYTMLKPFSRIFFTVCPSYRNSVGHGVDLTKLVFQNKNIKHSLQSSLLGFNLICSEERTWDGQELES